MSNDRRLSLDEVRHIANLSRLEVDENKMNQYSSDLSSILNYVDKLQEINTQDVDPTFRTAPLTNVFREDEIKPSMSQEKVLSNAPDKQGLYFKTPVIINKDS